MRPPETPLHCHDVVTNCAGEYGSEFFALFDHGRGDLEIFLAVVVTRATGYEAGIERGPDYERDVLLAESDIEIAYVYLPCSFERALGFLVGMLVELISKGNPAESEAELLLVDLRG